MLDRFDEADLLAFIEDELDPDRAAQVRRRLAGDPKTLALVERLQDDRQLLQSMDEPVVPADLMAELEPMMARPMLMPDPGDWRRRYRKRRPWKRYAAVAAVVALTLLGGVWAMTSGLIGFGRPAGSTLAVTDGGLRIEPDVALAEATGADPWPPAETVIHHNAPGIPTAAESPERMVTAERTGPDRRRRARGEVPQLTAARFVLVVTARDGQDERGIEQTLQRVLDELDGDAALVRNFSFQEAGRIVRRLRVEQGRHLDGNLARARDEYADMVGMVGMAGMAMGTAGSPRTEVDLPRRRRAAGRLARTLEQSGSPLTVSGQLVGPRSLAPTYEQQLEYSERGAIWTITVPADRLNDVLARLQLTEGQVTALQAWDADGAAQRTGVESWLKDYPQILREAAQLNGTVMLPVVIRE